MTTSKEEKELQALLPEKFLPEYMGLLTKGLKGKGLVQAEIGITTGQIKGEYIHHASPPSRPHRHQGSKRNSSSNKHRRTGDSHHRSRYHPSHRSSRRGHCSPESSNCSSDDGSSSYSSSDSESSSPLSSDDSYFLQMHRQQLFT